MEKYKTIDNWRFEWNQEHEFYECQGAICHDNEHDEIPEPELWEAALELEQELKDDGYVAEISYSEKGWVEVAIL
jgi:hypothetical protein